MLRPVPHLFDSVPLSSSSDDPSELLLDLFGSSFDVRVVIFFLCSIFQLCVVFERLSRPRKEFW